MTEAFNTEITALINGVTVEHTVENRLTLAEFLRDCLGLTGTKVSCQMQVCGVCSVLVDGRPVSACTFLAVDIDNTRVETVESLSRNGDLHPLQEEFVNRSALQCGFCTPGFLMMAKCLIDHEQEPSREEVAEYLEGNICRCTGYRPIIDAVTAAAVRTKKDLHE